ncbi:MAG: hypothetical protein IIY71_00580 [Oscillospiraceae bacterium]|nr:hypothetical protein [Oscillospiraceae bacterium]
MKNRYCIHCGAPLSDAAPSPVADTSAPLIFSRREQDVITLILSGYTEGQIAQTLYLTVGTIKTYKRNIFKKLGIHSRRELFSAIYQQERTFSPEKLPAGRPRQRSLFCIHCGSPLDPRGQYCGACGTKIVP